MTEREKVKLREIGKITAQQIKDAEVNDVAPPYRLACQFIAREEEVIIHYTGEPGGALTFLTRAITPLCSASFNKAAT